MSYKQYDKNGNEINHMDLQAKKLWCKDGEKIEQAFVNKYGENLQVQINPEKVQNPFAPDLIFNNEQLADLKTQNTPFFKAGSLYGIDPSYAVVFNQKDFIRYSEKYPNILIYFWVEWHSVKFEMGSFVNEVEYVNGVWRIKFSDLKKVLSVAPLHSYQQRKYDTRGNAKSSFVLDIRHEFFERLL
ncbi:hypothetical protein GCM10009431_01220 [Gaetbulibacter jejuensis]|uniref:Uncharacterized protein n=2 Tax=Gaetbulibacter jejuensis TaxID=584607 RepID=A0ABN1JCM2_9FLAO